MAERICCMVPGCRRTACAVKLAPHNQYLCTIHYPMVPKPLKLLRRRLRARHRDSDIGRRLDYWVWRRMVRAAIEISAGL